MELTLDSNSVYRNADTIIFDNGEGLLLRDNLIFDGSTTDSYHTVSTIDRLDLIAYKFYSKRVENSSQYWWVIADANDIENPLDLESLVNTEILIPDILNVLLKLQE